MKWSAPLFAISLTLAAAPRVHAQSAPVSAEAKAHLDRALTEFAAERYGAAAIEFQAAYASEPRREILFAWAQAERLRGACSDAITLYRQFLNLSPPEDEADKARALLARCEAAESEKKAATQRQAGPDETRTSEPLSTEPQPPAAQVTVGGQRAWYQDTLGDVLLGSGIAVAGLGTGLILHARSRANDATRYSEFEKQAEAADKQYRIGLVAVVAGGALVGLGVTRFLWASRSEAAQTTLAVDVNSSGIILSGKF